MIPVDCVPCTIQSLPPIKVTLLMFFFATMALAAVTCAIKILEAIERIRAYRLYRLYGRTPR